MGRAHPRSRGENIRASVRVDTHHGSSPLTRGKRAWRSSRPCAPRLIPAHAGKTFSTPVIAWASAAHPRSRGENAVGPCRRVRDAGSSPLTRGKLLHRGGHSDVDGLIPAHAGKTTDQTAVRGEGRAHPRSRGENVSIASSIVYTRGSSPLTRGKLAGPRVEHLAHGLIPAHAGKTAGFFSEVVSVTAHPRSRGENIADSAPDRSSRGSSPLTRGKLRHRPQSQPPVGLIPAHAGKTCARSFGASV